MAAEGKLRRLGESGFLVSGRLVCYGPPGKFSLEPRRGIARCALSVPVVKVLPRTIAYGRSVVEWASVVQR